MSDENKDNFTAQHEQALELAMAARGNFAAEDPHSTHLKNLKSWGVPTEGAYRTKNGKTIVPSLSREHAEHALKKIGSSGGSAAIVGFGDSHDLQIDHEVPKRTVRILKDRKGAKKFSANFAAGEHDEHAVREMELHADNTEHLVNNRKPEFIKSVMKKHAAGQYDHGKSHKLWGHFADEVSKSYKNEHGSAGGTGGHAFNKATRMAYAKSMADDHHPDQLKKYPDDHMHHTEGMSDNMKKKVHASLGWGKDSKKKVSEFAAPIVHSKHQVGNEYHLPQGTSKPIRAKLIKLPAKGSANRIGRFRDASGKEHSMPLYDDTEPVSTVKKGGNFAANPNNDPSASDHADSRYDQLKGSKSGGAHDKYHKILAETSKGATGGYVGHGRRTKESDHHIVKSAVKHGVSHEAFRDYVTSAYGRKAMDNVAHKPLQVAKKLDAEMKGEAEYAKKGTSGNFAAGEHESRPVRLKYGAHPRVQKFKLDANGNMRVHIKNEEGKSLSIQTNGTLPHAHRVSRNDSKTISASDHTKIMNEVHGYIAKHGTKRHKEILGHAEDQNFAAESHSSLSDEYKNLHSERSRLQDRVYGMIHKNQHTGKIQKRIGSLTEKIQSHPDHKKYRELRTAEHEESLKKDNFEVAEPTATLKDAGSIQKRLHDEIWGKDAKKHKFDATDQFSADHVAALELAKAARSCDFSAEKHKKIVSQYGHMAKSSEYDDSGMVPYTKMKFESMGKAHDMSKRLTNRGIQHSVTSKYSKTTEDPSVVIRYK